MRLNPYWDTVSMLQGAFLNSLGIYQAGYAPEHCVGHGRIVYDNRSLQDRLQLAGYQGPTIRTWFLGNVAMTTRTMYGVASAAKGSEENRHPLVSMRIQWKVEV